MQDLLTRFKELNYTLSFEEEREEIFKYVYLTNKLEGNKLTLAQTTQLLDTETISGDNIRTRDILEQKGMYKAVNRMRRMASLNKELSIDLLKELHSLVLGSLWKDDGSYLDAKSKGQELGEFKVSRNIIAINKGGSEIQRIDPLSSPENVKENIELLIQRINSSKKDPIGKAVDLAKNIWLHQPFVDGNKRLGRLLINFMAMKEGYPLFNYEDSKKGNYNSLLIKEVMENKKDLVLDYIQDRLKSTMQERLNSIESIKKLDLNKNEKGTDQQNGMSMS